MHTPPCSLTLLAHMSSAAMRAHRPSLAFPASGEPPFVHAHCFCRCLAPLFRLLVPAFPACSRFSRCHFRAARQNGSPRLPLALRLPRAAGGLRAPSSGARRNALRATDPPRPASPSHASPLPPPAKPTSRRPPRPQQRRPAERATCARPAAPSQPFSRHPAPAPDERLVSDERPVSRAKTTFGASGGTRLGGLAGAVVPLRHPLLPWPQPRPPLRPGS